MAISIRVISKMLALCAMSCWSIGATHAADGDPGLSYPNWIKACDTSAASGGKPICGAPDQFDFAALNYFPWTKSCRRGDPDAKRVCFTTKEGRSAAAAIMVVLIEPEKDAEKLFRVVVPLSVQLRSGVRISFDHGGELKAPFVVCFINGCIAEFKADAALISSLANAQTLTVQASSSNGSPLALSITTGREFRTAIEGPAPDLEMDERANRELKLRQQRAGAQPAISSPTVSP